MTIEEELADLSTQVPKLEADLATARALNVSLQADLDKAKADFAAQEAADPVAKAPPPAVDVAALKAALAAVSALLPA